MSEDDNGNSITKKKITVKEFIAAIMILGAIAFTAFTYINDRDVQLDAVVIELSNVDAKVKFVEGRNDEQDEEIQGIREGIGFMKGQLATLITMIDKLETQNERMLRSMKRRKRNEP